MKEHTFLKRIFLKVALTTNLEPKAWKCVSKNASNIGEKPK